MRVKIKNIEKAAILNKLKKYGVEISPEDIDDEIDQDYFYINVRPEDVTMFKKAIKNAPKIDTIKEHIDKMVTKLWK